MEKGLVPVGDDLIDDRLCNRMVETRLVGMSEDDGNFHKGCR
jgi:hypothetical protein